MSNEPLMIIFVGPTLPNHNTDFSESNIEFRPPAVQGAVLRAVDAHPWAIGIIDGGFEKQPAVQHKEILYAMTRGIHVFGASSMGALRAAELAPFGMEGVGKIFEQFHKGTLEDDDEVALTHTSAETGYDCASEAMVNIRATLEAAVDPTGSPSRNREKVLLREHKEGLEKIAKSLFFPERTYERILQEAVIQKVLSEERRDAFMRFLETGGSVDQKRLDAETLLETMKERRKEDDSPKTVNFTFQNTDAWIELQRAARQPVQSATNPSSLEQIQKEPERLARYQDQAWARVFGLELARNDPVDEVLLSYLIGDFCRGKGLLSPEALDSWLDEREMSYSEFFRLMKNNRKLDRLRHLYSSGRSRHSPFARAFDDILRLEGL